MHKIEVPYIDQSVKYPTGCESVSAVMLLKYLGFIHHLSMVNSQGREMGGILRILQKIH